MLCYDADKKAAIKMINNNLDFERSSTSSCSATTTPDSSTATTVNDSPVGKLTATTDNSNVNSRANTPTATARTAANDNSYFNRFDNRIAANLAAVINGSRFRSSSSCSRSATASPSRRTTTTTTKTPSLSNRAATLSLRSLRSQRQQKQQQPNAEERALNNTQPSSASVFSLGRPRPTQLLFTTHSNVNCNDNEKVMQTVSSDEDNSPTELNNCKRLSDKPPLVKRFAMGLKRSNEESRPLVNNLAPISIISSHTTHAVLNVSNTSTHAAIYANGYAEEEALGPERFIASRFGDSCRQSLTAIPMLDTLNLNDNSEFNLKKRYLRETSSANSSPKIFAHRLRLNSSTTHTPPSAGSFIDSCSSAIASVPATAFDADAQTEAELKDAPWFQAGISRDIAIEVLANESPGAFLVRRSTSKPGCYALTLRIPSPPGPKTTTYIILATARGYKIKGFRKEFSSLKALITHHSVMPELLPVPLAVPRPTNMTSSRRNLDDFDTYDSLQMLLKYLRAKNMEHE